MRRTVTNLSRITKVSRQTIYKHIDTLEIVKPSKGAEFTVTEFEILQRSVLKQPYDQLYEAYLVSRKVSSELTDPIAIPQEKIQKREEKLTLTGTTRERLDNAKQEYAFNREIIEALQDEISQERKERGNLRSKNGNGAQTTVPQLSTLEKYVKLNISISKQISELESDLDLVSDEELDGDPFA